MTSSAGTGEIAPRAQTTAPECLLCGARRGVERRSYEFDRLGRIWKDQFGIDVSGETRPGETVALRECLECGLEFFLPVTPGSGAFYAQLQRLSWYYPAFKWEHRMALQDLAPGSRVLEIGCGIGDFVQAMSDRGLRAGGIELNPAAVEEAVRKGRDVRHVMLADLIPSVGEQLDAVLAFQVLEHVPDPRQFLAECVALLKPGSGRLIIGVPNRDAYHKHILDVFNLPPHHITRWSAGVVASAAGISGLRVRRIMREPLAAAHLGQWCGAMVSRVTGTEHIAGSAPRASERVLGGAVRALRAYRWLLGHSLYACLER